MYLCQALSHLRYNLDSFANALKSLGIEHIVVSPGSRNAPIVAGFIRIGGFRMLSAPDERAAAFMALGSAQATGKPAVVICTSGTAVLNLYPGICEAYYQRIPLIALTADRPENLIDQWDGQTIHQENIFEKHILHSFHPKTDLHKKEAEQELLYFASQAAGISSGMPNGPVHINIPLSEPIYQNLDSPVATSFNVPEKPAKPTTLEFQIPDKCISAEKILFLVGQKKPDNDVSRILQGISVHYPVVADVLSHVDGKNIIKGTENISALTEQHRPDILITLGLGVVSKSLKQELRKLNIPAHIQLGDGGFTGDPFFTQPETIHIPAAVFLEILLKTRYSKPCPAFYDAWQSVIKESELKDTEAALVKTIVNLIPDNSCLQLANSMTVRHANRCKNLPDRIFGNRGTSGIDGSVSTAVGYAWAKPEQKVYSITGDIGFLYDKNAWWCNPLPKNILVIIINNHGGMIFDRLQGPEKLPELRNFVHTEHHFNAKAIAEHYEVSYNACNAIELLRNLNDLKGFIENISGILEIFTP